MRNVHLTLIITELFRNLLKRRLMMIAIIRSSKLIRHLLRMISLIGIDHDSSIALRVQIFLRTMMSTRNTSLNLKSNASLNKIKIQSL